MRENILNKIKNLPKQTEESLNDALGLAVQIEDVPTKLYWLRWVRKEAMKLMAKDRGISKRDVYQALL